MKRFLARAHGTILAVMLGGCTVISDAFNDLIGHRAGMEDIDLADSDDEIDALFASEQLDASAGPDLGETLAEPTAVATLERAPQAMPLPGRGATNLGFRIDKLAAIYALAGAVESPPWSAESQGSPRSVRDNDLDTAWTCVPRGEDRCSIGISFPAAAKVMAVRLFAASAAFETHPRIKRVRVHTQRGFTDALLPDRNSHVYVVMGEDVVTRYLVVEVLEVHPGRSKVPTIHVAELEVFGSQGAAREPVRLDPATAIVGLTDKPWRAQGRDSYARSPNLFIHTVDAAGVPHRLIAGTALRGQAGDRLLLVERLQTQSGCSAPRGTFFLLDTQTRVVAPLGDLGGIAGDTFRANNGLGIFVGFRGKLDTKLAGVFVDGHKYQRRQTPIRDDLRTDDYFRAWDLDEDPVRRVPAALNEAPAGCEIGDDDALAELASAKTHSSRSGSPRVRPGEWQVCSLNGGARAFVTDHGPCGTSWEITVVDADGALVDTRSAARSRSLIRVVPHGAGHYLMQVGGGTDAASVVRVSAQGIREVSQSASFGLQPPSACRVDCVAQFPNPHAPVWN